jgi:hypothetical protein
MSFFPNEMMFHFMCLVLVCKIGFFTSFNALWLSHCIIVGSSPLACDSINKAHNQAICLAISNKTQYSTFILDNAIMD